MDNRKGEFEPIEMPHRDTESGQDFAGLNLKRIFQHGEVLQITGKDSVFRVVAITRHHLKLRLLADDDPPPQQAIVDMTEKRP